MPSFVSVVIRGRGSAAELNAKISPEYLGLKSEIPPEFLAREPWIVVNCALYALGFGSSDAEILPSAPYPAAILAGIAELSGIQALLGGIPLTVVVCVGSRISSVFVSLLRRSLPHGH